MAVLNDIYPSLLDAAKTLDPDGTTADIVELLTRQNEVLLDAVWVQGNLPTGHRVTVRTGLPEVYWRLINQGVPPSKSTTAQVDEGCAMLEAYSETDTRLLQLFGENARSFRLTEDAAFLEAMNQRVAETMFYGTASNPEQFVGFAPRYSSTTAPNGKNILSAGGSGSDLTSVWLIAWGGSTVHGIFPKGSTAGFSARDLGEDTAVQAGGRLLQVQRTHFKWDCGLVVRDWRYAVRIANLKVGDLIAATGTQGLDATTNLLYLMTRAIHRLPSRNMGRPVFYAAREVLSQLMVMAQRRSAPAVLSIQQAATQFGDTFTELQFLGIPIRAVDALLLNETAVS